MKNIISRVNVLLLSLLLVSFFHCKKVNDTEKSYHLSVDKIFPNIGEAGTLVTISGQGYSLILTEDTVLFNGKIAGIKMATDTSIQVYAPANNTTGTVTISVRGKIIDGPVFTYVNKNEPAIVTINPEAGWDYTINSVTIKGIHFGNNRDKVSVLFDNIAASLQSFSDTSLIVSPPTHAAGKVPVIVTVDGKSSNTVYYTYQQKPEISNVNLQEWDAGDGRYYFISVKNLAPEDLKNILTINGNEIKPDSIFRSGSAEYNMEPVGEKMIVRLNEAGDDGTLDFVVTANGFASNPFHYVNEPRILDIFSLHNYYLERRKTGPGDTLRISGQYFAAQQAGSVIELWSTSVLSDSVHLTPNPAIISWSNTDVKVIIPDYHIQTDSVQMVLKLKENGKEADALITYYGQQQSSGGGGTCMATEISGNDPNLRPITYEFDNAGHIILVNQYQQGYLFDSTIVSANQLLQSSADGYSVIRTVFLQDNAAPANIYETAPDSATVFIRTGGQVNERAYNHYRYVYDNLKRLVQIITYSDDNVHYSYMYFDYDNNDNLTQLRYVNPQDPNSPGVTFTSTGYDDKHSPFDAIKYGAFLATRDYSYPSILFFKLSKNNPLSYNEEGSFSEQYSYQYNANGYPIAQSINYTYRGNSASYQESFSYLCK